MFAPSPSLYLVGSICWFLFFSFITWSELRSVLKQREVTSETISLAISVYLLFGLTWGVLYIVLFQCQPDAFSFAASPSPTSALADNPQHIFPVFIYFSLTTLSTIGFGDITPMTLQARYAAVAEGINKVPKVVFSRTLDKASWNNTKLVAGDLAAEIRKMKNKPGEQMVIMGSGTIVSQLTAEGLIDEYQIVVNPIVLAKGRTMFEGIKRKLNLKRTKTRSFGNGNVLLCYEPIT